VNDIETSGGTAARADADRSGTEAAADAERRSEDARDVRRLWLLLLVGVVVIAFSLFIGRFPTAGFTWPWELLSDDIGRTLFLTLRLPRVLAAFLVGASLAGGGLVLQHLFGNPLVEPGLVGVSQGAAFGAALTFLVAGAVPGAVQGVSALFGFAGLILSYTVARHARFGGWILRLILAGIVVSALFSSGVGVIKFAADPYEELPEITFWLLGGLSGVTWQRLVLIVPFAVPSLILLYLMRWRVNVLSLEDEVSFSLGIAPARDRAILLVAATVATSVSVSIAGIISWVGLVMPHVARRLFRVDTRFGVPAAILLGGIFLVLCDDLARTLLAGEIPLGVVTSLIGSVLFGTLLLRGSVRIRR
jgi:iron complex transport system permease protein